MRRLLHLVLVLVLPLDDWLCSWSPALLERDWHSNVCIAFLVGFIPEKFPFLHNAHPFPLLTVSNLGFLSPPASDLGSMHGCGGVWVWIVRRGGFVGLPRPQDCVSHRDVVRPDIGLGILVMLLCSLGPPVLLLCLLDVFPVYSGVVPDVGELGAELPSKKKLPGNL